MHMLYDMLTRTERGGIWLQGKIVVLGGGGILVTVENCDVRGGGHFGYSGKL
jgi:hypothetical protein